MAIGWCLWEKILNTLSTEPMCWKPSLLPG